jgi:beta-lactam-binding protein with PASTA domain
LIGRVFDDRYEVLSKLGSGGMADVFLANDRLLDRQVALKILSSRYANDEQFIERFRREASSAASLNHPNIVQIYDRGEAEGTYYIAMEYLEGRSLKEIILKYAPLSPELVVSVSVQILEALRFAHRRDVIHRDIKPQNMIVDNEGRVKVTDFGIARAGSASTMTEAGSIMGTAHYLSPEQAQGQPVEAASDLYSLGVVMFEMATGNLPFDGDNPVALAMRHVHDQPPHPRSIVPTIPENLDAVILHALGKLPTERYLTAQQFLEDLRSVQEGKEVKIPAAYVEQQTTRVMSAPSAAAAVGAAAGAGAMVAAQPTQVRRHDPAGIMNEPPLPSAYYDEPPRRRSGGVWPWILVLILIVALGAGAYAMLSNWTSAGTEDLVVVPGVLGLSEADAAEALEMMDFEIKVEGEQASADVEEGLVARQEPEEGTKQTRGSTVSVWLSSGEGAVEVPNVVGKTQVEATNELLALGLQVLPQEEPSADQPPGTVLRQDPGAGAEAKAGAKVTIVVATQANTVQVPRLIGRNQDAAIILVEGLGLTYKVEEVDSTEVGGTVVDQDPAEGAQVEPGAEVTIFVSNAPEATTVKVPAVVGLTRQQAAAKLVLFELEAYVVTVETPDYEPGRVIEQDPTAGVEVEKGSSVRISVAAAPPSTTTTTAPPTTTTSTTEPPTTTTSTTAPPTTEF